MLNQEFLKVILMELGHGIKYFVLILMRKMHNNKNKNKNEKNKKNLKEYKNNVHFIFKNVIIMVLVGFNCAILRINIIDDENIFFY